MADGSLLTQIALPRMRRWLADRLERRAMRRHRAAPPGLHVPARSLIGGSGFEALEPRVLLSFSPSGFEQEMLELINRMRQSPQDELALLADIAISPTPRSSDPDVNSALSFFDVDGDVLQSQWDQLVAAPPLAWDAGLYDAAHAHNQLVIEFDEQSHQLPGEDDLRTRVEAAGYQTNAALRESVFAFADSVFHAHAAFAIDWGFSDTGIQQPPGHRDAIMDASMHQVGIAWVAESDGSTEVGPFVTTHDFGGKSTDAPFGLGVVFVDDNGDGFYTAGEGVGGVDVTVTGPGGTFNTTTMTAGGWQVQLPKHQSPEQYTVTFSGGGIGDTPRISDILVGEDNVKADLLLEGASITGQVLLDLDGDGIDDGEQPIEGLELYLDLLDDGDPTGDPVVTTNALGQYSFDDLDPGSYIVRQILPDGLAPTNPADNRTVITVGLGEPITGVDFLNRSTLGSVGGTVYEDFDRDGVEDPGDTGLPGVAIQLRDSQDVLVDTEVTDNQGNYLFLNVPEGDYTIVQTPPATQDAITGATANVTTVTGQLSDADFGNTVKGTITGTLYRDLDADGERDIGETGIGSVAILLNGEVATTTNSQGQFTINNVSAGDHTLTAMVGESFTFTTAAPLDITLPSSGSVQTTFGAFEPGSISGVAFEDDNANGQLDAGEGGLQGALVFLDDNGDGTRQIDEQQTLTSADGSYSFTDLTTRNYIVRIGTPVDYVASTPTSQGLNLSSGDDLTANFGQFTTADITGVVFHDFNEDGLHNGDDLGLDDITIQLRDSSGVLIDTAVTDATGAYSFADLSPGDYQLQQALPFGRLATTTNPVALTLTSGESAAVNHGSIVATSGSISGTVIEDRNNNGVADAGDQPLAGVTVYLDENQSGDFDSLDTSTTTDANGDYLFADLDLDIYAVRIALTDGFDQVLPANDEAQGVQMGGGDFTGNDFLARTPVPLPDLTAAIDMARLPQTFVPGDRGMVRVSVDNIGEADAFGELRVELYAMTGDVLDPDSDILLAEFDRNARLREGRSMRVNMRLDIPADIEPGDYTLVAVVDASNNFAERDEANNTAAEATRRTAALRFGTFDDRRNVRLELDGVMYMLRSDGFGEVMPREDGLTDITVTGASDRSSAMVRTPRNTVTQLGAVTVDGALNSFDARDSDITETLAIDGTLRRLSLRNASGAITIGPGDDRASAMVQIDRAENLSLTSATPLRMFQATEWLDTDDQADQLAAPSVNSLMTRGDRRLSVDGDFEADLLLDGSDNARATLNRMRIAGSVDGRTWQVTGDAGMLMISGQTDGLSLQVDGDLRGLRLGSVLDASVQATGSAGALMASQWLTGSIVASEMTMLRITGDRRVGLDGDFGARVTLTDANARASARAIMVSGAIEGSTMTFASDISIIMADRLANSDIRIGVDPLLIGLPDQPSDFTNPDASLRMLNLGGRNNPDQPTLTGTLLATPDISRLSLTDVDTTGPATTIVADTISSYMRRTADDLIRLSRLDDPADNLDTDGAYRLIVV